VINSNTNRLSPEEIERMIKDSERFAEEDKKVKDRVDAKNELESYVYSLKTQLADKEKLGGKLSSDEKSTIEKEIEEKIKWLDENQASAEVDDFKAQKKSIEDVVTPIMTKLYQGQPPPPGSDVPPTGDDGNKDEL
jgi:heat shock protein 5